ncbi:MAG: hypothetical protein KA369_22045 [Spirochaetes bacterium]|nr:hypothetical protein [Spirochaetota bacterium]
MKKSVLLTVLLCACLGAALGCEQGGDNSKKNSSLLGLLTGDSGIGGASIDAPASVTATDGVHSDKIGITWEVVDGAAGYKVYRSDTKDGTFTSIGTVLAADLAATQVSSKKSIVAVKPLYSSDSTATTQAVFQSDVDLGAADWFGNIGVYIIGLSTCKIHIVIGDSIDTVVEFSGHTWGSFYTQDEVVDLINAAVGTTVCYAVDDGDAKYVKIVSTGGAITLENDNDPLIYVPLKHLLKSDATKSTVITVEPVVVDDGEDDGDDGSGAGDGGSTEQSGYCFTDTDITVGTHYFYAVTAIDQNDAESVYSAVDEGFSADPNAPGKVTGVTASDGSYADRVSIAWTAVDRATKYRVFRTDWNNASVQVGGDITGTSCEDTGVPAGAFKYKVVPFADTLEGVHSDPDQGYRSVTDHEFFTEFMTSINYTSKRLTKMGSLGNQTITDINGGGTCVYTASGGLSGADILIAYTDYCDLYMTMNGSQHTVITDVLSQNGTLSGCQIDVAGVYTGYVRYDLVIKSGKPAGGYYYVSQNGGAETQIPYNYQ